MSNTKNVLVVEKQKLVDYRKKYYKMRKMPYYNYKKLFPFDRKSFFRNYGKFIYFLPGFRKFASYTISSHPAL